MIRPCPDNARDRHRILVRYLDRLQAPVQAEVPSRCSPPCVPRAWAHPPPHRTEKRARGGEWRFLIHRPIGSGGQSPCLMQQLPQARNSAPDGGLGLRPITLRRPSVRCFHPLRISRECITPHRMNASMRLGCLSGANRFWSTPLIPNRPGPGKKQRR